MNYIYIYSSNNQKLVIINHKSEDRQKKNKENNDIQNTISLDHNTYQDLFGRGVY
jgi:hypothetical protein